MLHVLVDGRVIDHPTAGGRGVGRYTVGFVRGLLGFTERARVEVLVDHPEQERAWLDALPEVSCRPLSAATIREVVEGCDPNVDRPWFVCTQQMLHPIALDVVPRFVTEAGIPVVGITHDVIPQRFPSRYLVDPVAATQVKVRETLLRTFDAMVSNSVFSADTTAEVIGFPRERIFPVGAAVEPRFSVGADEPAALAALFARGVDRSRRPVVAVTGGDDRKNTPGLIRAWALLPESLRAGHQLVVACEAVPAVRDRWNHVAVHAGLTTSGRPGSSSAADVAITGTVTDDEMVALYRRATLSVFPSLEEGFGLPVAEAAACGCPVICSNNSSLPEVIGDPLATFDAHDTGDMAAAIEQSLVDDAHRSRLRELAARAAARWTFDNVGRATVEALESCSTTARLNRVPWRVALMGPFGQSATGVGNYDRHVAEAWDRVVDCELERWVDVTASPAVLGEGERNAAGVGRHVRAHDVDHVVAVLGSSPYHAITAARAAETACHVWLHEPTLVGCHVGVAHLSASRRWAEEHVRDELRADLVDESRWPNDLLDARAHHKAGITFLGPVLRRARSVIVSSREAADVVAVEFARLGVAPVPVLVAPHANHVLERATMVGGPRVVSAGWLDDTRRPDVLVRAVALVDGATLEFVGPHDPSVRESTEALAESLGAAARVSFVGHVSDDEYDRRLRAARVGVQLRRDARGQRSGAVADLRSRGIPTITDLDDGEATISVDSLTAALAPLLFDDEAWRRASDATFVAAREWTFEHVARAVRRWLDEVPDLDSSAVVDASSLV